MKENVKRGKDEEVNGHGGKEGAPAPHGGAFWITQGVRLTCVIRIIDYA